MDKIETLEKILDFQLTWISRADSRISLILPLGTAMLGALAALAPEPCKWNILCIILTSLSTLLILVSLIFSSLAIFPRTKGPKSSNIFFNGIAARDMEKYKKIMHKISDNEYIDDLCHQCHRNAQIAKTKTSWIQRALALLLLSVIPWIVAVYLLYSVK
jgi:hypothetical protein